MYSMYSNFSHKDVIHFPLKDLKYLYSHNYLQSGVPVLIVTA